MRIVIMVPLLFGAHFSLTALVPGRAGKAAFYWPFAADTKSTLGFLQLSKLVTQLLSIIAGAALLAAAAILLGIVVPANWWPQLVVVGAMASVLLYVLYFGAFALLPIAIDAVLVWGVIVRHWSATGMLTLRDVFLTAVVAVFVFLVLLAVLTGRRLFRRLARTHHALPLASVLCFTVILLPSGSNAPDQGRLRIGAPLTTREGPDYRQYIFERWSVMLKDGTAQWSREEIKLIYEVLYDIERKVGQVAYVNTVCEMRSAWEGLTLRRMHRTNNPFGNMAWVPPGHGGRYIEIPDGGPDNGLWEDEVWTKHILAEEFGHAWDFRLSMGSGWNGGYLSGDMESYVGADASRCLTLLICASDDTSSPYDPGDERPVSEHAASSPSEDWGGAFAQYVEPLPNQELGQKRMAYVRSRLDKLDDPFWAP